MALYAIVLNGPSDHAWTQVRETWPKHHFLDERVALISVDEVLTKDISDAVGIGAEHQISGLVIQMDYFAGHTDASLVEWISKNRG